ncbi:HAD hydrolase-like protein [Inhella crocodyli]|nr:HAD hydrolase-like protein [Inhella crocodyli]
MHPMETRPPVLVFDLDGTLSDPAEGIGKSFDFALARHGHPPLRPDQRSFVIGPPLDVSFRALTGIDEAAHIAELVAAYRERYKAVGYAENVVYPGIPEALAGLRAAGRRLGVCSSKRVDFCEMILALFGLRQHFEFVSGGDVGIPKAQQLGELLAQGAIDGRATMIGDRAVDVVAAQAHGLASVGVLWGHGSQDELVSAGAQRLLAAPADLMGLA